MTGLQQRALNFLYDQVQSNKIPQIKKGMVDDLVGFVESILAEQEAKSIAFKLEKKLEEAKSYEEKEPTIKKEL